MSGRGGRRPGEVRQALLQAVQDLCAEGVAPVLEDIVCRSKVGRLAALCGVKNMRRAGVLVVVGERRMAGRNRPVNVYGPAVAQVQVVQPGVDVLAAGLRAWGVCGVSGVEVVHGAD